jgi:predicted methyltransferase
MRKLVASVLLAVAAPGLILAGTVASAAEAGTAAKIYQEAVAHEGRSAADRERDARELPAEVMEFAGIRPGMKIADVLGGGGYYSELVSHVVGPKGQVLLINNPGYARYSAEGQAKRFTPGRLPNIERSNVPNDNLGLAKNSLDGAMMVMAYHDLYWVSEKDGWPKIDADRFLAQMVDAIRPGGFVLIVDHAAQDGTGSGAAGTLHRIEEKFARADFEKHGLKFEKSFDKLRNEDDDRSALVFNPAIRGKTDRFVHLYRKP